MQVDVGKKVTNYRRTHGITIKELADRTGVSMSLISQLERGIGNPTMSALGALADGMGITLAHLVSAELENRHMVCRKENRFTVREEGDLLLQSVLVEDTLNTSLSVLMMELQPHADSCRGFEVHLEEECLCVLSGEIVVMFEQEEFHLREGDSIRVLPNRRHMVRNDGDTVATAMNIKCKVQY